MAGRRGYSTQPVAAGEALKPGASELTVIYLNRRSRIMGYKFLVVPIILLISSCSPSPQYKVQKLPSGKEIKILSMGKMHFAKDLPALTLKYQTDISIENVDLLRQEVEEIWPVFRVNAERSGLSKAIVMATSPPIRKALILSTTRSYNFIATKRENGTWDLNSWKRNYDKEGIHIAERYLGTNKRGNTASMAKAFHCPDYFTSEQLNSELDGISRVLDIITDKLGTVESYKLNNSQIIYFFFALRSASQEYWNKHPYFNRLIYDVEYSDKGSGYLVFSFSTIKDEVVLSTILYGLPVDNPETEMVFKELNEKMKELNNT
jgi:hypothetical protein